MEESALHSLVLSLVPGLGAIGYLRLIDTFGSASAALAASEGALLDALEGIPRRRKIVQQLAAGPQLDQVAREQGWLEAPNRSVVCLEDIAYPALLRTIPDPPPVLFIDGDATLLEAPQIAIVGSRKATAGGVDTAKALAFGLARAGISVTSGLATGIDSAAHSGALDAAGSTIAVAGTGLDTVYPRSSQRLADRIRARGAMVSEYRLGTKPSSANFPRRNRIISGLSLGTLVVEAATRSGSLITARLAAEQGREVFAVPGSIHNPQSRGCHGLIRDGAKLVENVNDILVELAPQLRAALINRSTPTADSAGMAVDEADSVLVSMGHDPVTVDQIVARTGLTAAEVSTKLLGFELEGRVAQHPGGRFARIA